MEPLRWHFGNNSVDLINPAELPQNFTNTTAAAEILGVRSVTAYQACCNCNKKLVIETSPILTCSTCGLKQNMKSTIQQCYVQLLVQIKESKITVTLFNDILHDMLASQGKSTLPITEETITAFLLELPTITSITFNNKTKIVESVQIWITWTISCHTSVEITTEYQTLIIPVLLQFATNIL